ncbi:MAG: hypothetical protein K6T26_04835 [Alicyclobacillus sp.]|nr:hypothetical protein [Alicyclobacillus sp.]
MSKRREPAWVNTLTYLERWGTLVWRLVSTACADHELACAAFTRTFVQWYQRTDRLRHFPGEAWMAAALAGEACVLLTPEDAGAPPEEAANSGLDVAAGELAETQVTPCAVCDCQPEPPVSPLIQAVRALPVPQRLVWLTFVFGGSGSQTLRKEEETSPVPKDVETTSHPNSLARSAVETDHKGGGQAPWVMEPATVRSDEDVWVTLSRVLLLPVPVVRKHMQAAVAQLQASLAAAGKPEGVCANRGVESTPRVATEWPAWLETANRLRRQIWSEVAAQAPPEWLWVRTEQAVRAAAAWEWAERQHRGPAGWTYALAAAAAFGVATTAWGAVRAAQSSSAPVTTVSASPSVASAGLTAPWTGLPTVLLAQYRFDPGQLNRLSSVALGETALYIGSLLQHSDAWPEITVQRCPYSTRGTAWADALQPAGTIGLVPPLTEPATGTLANHGSPSAANSVWHIAQWSLFCSEPWVLAVVTWQAGDSAAVQVYALHLASGASGLAKGFPPVPRADVPRVAIGDNKLVVQGPPSGSAGTASATAATVPVQVYTFTGSTPWRLLSDPVRLPAAAGWFKQPQVVADSLVCQGFAGAVDKDSETTWASLSWDGQWTHYAGPHTAGVSYQAVAGSNGRLWWCSTQTGVWDGQQGLRVQAGPLVPAGENPGMQVTLQGTVLWFAVTGQRVAWVQAGPSGSELVVEQWV